MGLPKIGKAAKFGGKTVKEPLDNTGRKNTDSTLSEADQGLFDARTALEKNMEKRALEMSLWDLDGGFSKKQWAVGGAAAAGGAGYLGMGHQGKQNKNKKKDDTLKFLGY